MRGGYSTIYLRKKFDVSDLETVNRLYLDVMFDDGVNIWINGYNVVSDNVYSDEEPFDATTANRSEDHTFTRFTLSQPDDYLLEGTNVIAVQVINQSLGDSSDCFIDVCLADVLSSEGTTGNDDSFKTTSRKYEIETLWQTDELTSFDSTIQIPADEVKIGRTYRVRCRMKDNTNRWSHWSDPIQFTAGRPLSNNILSDLRITEIMYHPLETNNHSDPNEEYIELKNIGTRTLNLAGICLTNGVDFTFPDLELDAGEYILVVKDLAAFTAQYEDGLYIAGEYSGKLDNAGERIKLEDAFGQTILDFEYADDWYDVTDGEGFSLTIKDPYNPDPNSWSRQDAWCASAFAGGSPGWDDTDVIN